MQSSIALITVDRSRAVSAAKWPIAVSANRSSYGTPTGYHKRSAPRRSEWRRASLASSFRAATEHIEKIILSGGPAVGKSPLMPANPDLSTKPDVIRALRIMVRNFGAQM
jgi:hypothetical protein